MSRDSSTVSGDKPARSNAKVEELGVSEKTYPWHQFKPSCLCGCFNFVLQLVFIGSLGSFLFGFNIALLNTCTKTINSAFLQCGRDGDAFFRFEGKPQSVCEQYSECMDNCDIVNGTASCDGGYNLLYGHLSVDECLTIPTCVDKCGKEPDSNGRITRVACPGGYNDIDCDALKWYNAVLQSSVMIGAIVGSMAGSRALQFGRRMVLLVTMCVFMIGIVCTTTSNSFSALIWGRLVVGFAVGMVSVASPTYMSEVTPKERRGSYGVCHQLLVTVGIFIPMLLGLPLVNPGEQDDMWVPDTFQQFWWRFMLALGIVPTLLTFYLLLRVYSFETPVYYVEQRRFKDAASILELIHSKQDIKEELDSIIENVRQGEINKENGMSFGSAFKDSEYRYVIIVGILLSAFQQFGGVNVFMTSSSEIFKKAGLNGTMQTAMSIIMSGINVIMTFPTLYLVERMGRKSLLLTGSTLQFIFVIPAAIMYWVDKDSNVTQILAIVGVLGFVVSFAVAYGPVLWVYLFEVYPMEIKDVAAGVATAANWVAAFVIVFVSNLLENQVAFTLFAVLQLIATLIIAFMLKETRGYALGDSPFITKKNKV